MSAYRGPMQEMVEESIQQALEPTYMEVINTSHGRAEDESHFKVVCISDKFEGKRLVMRHRMVNEAVADESGALPFHSLEIAVAKTPSQVRFCYRLAHMRHMCHICHMRVRYAYELILI